MGQWMFNFMSPDLAVPCLLRQLQWLRTREKVILRDRLVATNQRITMDDRTLVSLMDWWTSQPAVSFDCCVGSLLVVGVGVGAGPVSCRQLPASRATPHLTATTAPAVTPRPPPGLTLLAHLIQGFHCKCDM